MSGIDFDHYDGTCPNGCPMCATAKIGINAAYGKGAYPMDAVSAYPPVDPDKYSHAEDWGADPERYSAVSENDYRVSQGVHDLILVTCQHCGTEMVFADGVRLEDIGNAVTAHETDADNRGCRR